MGKQFTLKIQVHNFWQVSSGHGTGALLDVVTHRDADGLPCLPGRSVKGLLRDAVFRAESWGHVPEGTANEWFGTRSGEDGEQISSSDTEPGSLDFTDAIPHPQVTEFLRRLRRDKLDSQKNIDALFNGFFHVLYATAMENGIAKPKSLRSSEVVIPLELYADLNAPDAWQEKDLKKCLPLIQAIGAGTNRGLGRATVSLEDKSDA